MPSTPATLGYVQQKYGKLQLASVMEPAIAAAREGFKVSPLLNRMIVKEEELLRQDPLVYKNYFHNDKPKQVGDIITQPELARCLAQLAQAGWQDFYMGNIGSKILEDMRERGGLISSTDLSQIPQPVEREALTSSYRDFEVHTFPPPGAGRVLVLLLNILENFPSEILDPEDPVDCLTQNNELPLVAINEPFKGGYITTHHGQGELPWIQLEINRSIYLPRGDVSIIPNDRQKLKLKEIRDRLYKVFSSICM